MITRGAVYLQLISLYAAPRRCLLLLIIYCFSEILVSLYLPTVSVFLGILNLRARSLAWRREFSYFCRGHTGGGGVLGHQYFGRILFYYQVVNFAISYYRSHLHAYIYIYIYMYVRTHVYTSTYSRMLLDIASGESLPPIDLDWVRTRVDKSRPRVVRQDRMVMFWKLNIEGRRCHAIIITVNNVRFVVPRVVCYEDILVIDWQRQ